MSLEEFEVMTSSLLYLPKYFKTHELVTPELYALVGDLALHLLAPELLMAADKLREKFGPITINNWYWGGAFRDSGLRNLDSKVGATKSAHKIGQALDLKFSGITPLEVADYITKDATFKQLIKRIENPKVTRTWLHIDNVAHSFGGIYVFNP